MIGDIAGGAGELRAEMPAGQFVALGVLGDDGQTAMAAVQGGFQAARQPVIGHAAGTEPVGHDGEADGVIVYQRGAVGAGCRGGVGAIRGGGLGGEGAGVCLGRCGAGCLVGFGALSGLRYLVTCGLARLALAGLAGGFFALDGGGQILALVDAGVALGLQLGDDFPFVEAGRYQNREGDVEAGILQRGGPLAHGGGDAGHVVDPDRLGALPAVQGGGMGHQQLQMVVQLGHRADRGARGAYRVGLIDGDGRWHAVDAVDLGTVHPVEELAGVGREGLDVATLALGIEGVEDQRGLAAARDAGDHHQLAGGDVQIQSLQVVLPGAADADGHLRVGMGGSS